MLDGMENANVDATHLLDNSRIGPGRRRGAHAVGQGTTGSDLYPGASATGAVAGGDRSRAAAAAAHGDRPAAAFRGGAGDVLASRPLGLGRHELDVDDRSVCGTPVTAGDLGAGPLGAAADRRLRLDRRTLAGLTIPWCTGGHDVSHVIRPAAYATGSTWRLL